MGLIKKILGYFTANAGTSNHAIYTSAGDVYVAAKVGIGNETPEVKLKVSPVTSSAADGIVIDQRGNSADPILGFEIRGTREFTMGVDDTDLDKFKIGTTSLTSGTRITIDATGQVGIGDTTPSEKLDVNGSIRTSGASTTSSSTTGHVLAVPVAGQYYPSTTSATVHGYANWTSSESVSDATYLGFVFNRDYIEIKKAGYYLIIADVTAGNLSAGEFATIKVEIHTSSGLLEGVCTAKGASGGSQMNLSCCGIEQISAGRRIKLWDNDTNSNIFSGSLTDPRTSLKIIKLN